MLRKGLYALVVVIVLVFAFFLMFGGGDEEVEGGPELAPLQPAAEVEDQPEE